MYKQLTTLFLLLLTCQAVPTHAADTAQPSTPGEPSAVKAPPPAAMKPMVIATENDVRKIDGSGTVAWQAASGVSRDVQVLPNGNILFPFNQNKTCGAREVDPTGKTAWEFTLPGNFVMSCRRLADGNTLVGASVQGAVLVVSPAGEVLHTIKVRGAEHKKHATTIVRPTADGNVLVVEEAANYVTEYTLGGSIVWEFMVPFRPFGVERLPNGNTMISGQDGMIEVTADKEIVWQLTKEDVVDMGPRWFAGFQVLPGGNIMVCNAGGGVPVFEVDRDKKVVWQASLTMKDIGMAHGICVLP